MWLAHYSFHFLTSYDAVVPAAQRFVADLGLARASGTPGMGRRLLPARGGLAAPAWRSSSSTWGCSSRSTAGYRIARGHTPTAWRAFVPWALLIVLLFAAGVWIVFQPMQMRGTMRGWADEIWTIERESAWP